MSWSRQPLPTEGPEAVFLRVIPEPNSGCWLWLGPMHTEGYGYISKGGRWWKMAHRWVYEQLIGPIPEGLELHHKCETPLCVNPQHMKLCTRREHMETDGRLRNGKIYHALRQAA